MAVNVLNSTTVTPALTALDNRFAVGATTNIVVGYLLAVRGELMKVVEIPVSGTVVVRRGYQGTRAIAHPAGVRAWIGTPASFKTIASTQLAIVGNSGTLPDYLLPGSRAFDQNGNEYVLVELTATAPAGALLNISVDGNFYGAPLLGGSHQGPVGLLVEYGTSDQYVWALVKGYGTAQEGMGTTGATSTYRAFAMSTASSPQVGLKAIPTPCSDAMTDYRIFGLFIVGAATTATTSAKAGSPPHTGVEVPVYLNYPYIEIEALVQITTS